MEPPNEILQARGVATRLLRHECALSPSENEDISTNAVLLLPGAHVTVSTQGDILKPLLFMCRSDCGKGPMVPELADGMDFGVSEDVMAIDVFAAHGGVTVPVDGQPLPKIPARSCSEWQIHAGPIDCGKAAGNAVDAIRMINNTVPLCRVQSRFV